MAVILGLKFGPHAGGGWIDTRNGVLYRRAARTAEARKRTPPVPLPSKLLAHLRRWEREDSPWVVSYGRCGVASIKSAWVMTRERVGLADVVPHTLRHTAITCAMRAGVDRWAASGCFGNTMEELERTYGHHHPNHLVSTVEAANRRSLRFRLLLPRRSFCLYIASLGVAGSHEMDLSEFGEDGLFAPRRIAEALHTTSDEVARTIGLGRDAVQRRDRVRSGKVQRRLREMVEVINKVEPRFGSALMAYAWYRSEPLAGFSGMTAMQLVREGRAQEVLDYVDAVDAGIHA